MEASVKDRFEQAFEQMDSPSKGKNEIPKLNPSQEIKEAVEKYLDAAKQKRDAESKMTEAEKIILPYVQRRRDKDGFNNNFHKSYKVVGTTKTVTVTYKNQYTIKPTDELTIRHLLGENFDGLLIKKRAAKVRPEVFDSEELMTELLTIMGDRISTFLQYSTELVVKENFDENIYKMVNKDQLTLLRDLVRQYKASITNNK